MGVGHWGHTPQLALHPQRYGVMPVPWLVADGYIANYQEVLNELPLILVTSNWVKEMYVQDIAKYLLILMKDENLRNKMGVEARKHVVENFYYRIVAQRFITIMRDRLGIS